MHEICVIGEGSFGTAIANLIAKNGRQVKLWCYDSKIAQSINKNHINSQYFPNFILDKKINAVTNFSEIKETKYIFEAIPIKFLRSILQSAKPFVNKNQIWISLSKGIEQESLLFPSQIINNVFDINLERAVLSGPSFASEIINEQITAVNIACKNVKIANELNAILENNYFKVFIYDDLLAIEICAALKNVISLAIGMCDGTLCSDNTKGLILTIGFNEIIKIIKHFNGNPETINKLCGIGDLIISSFGKSGRNYKVGKMIAQGKKIDEILKDVNLTAEGVNSVQSIYQLIKKENLDLPLCKGIYEVIFENKKFKKVLEELINLDLKI